MWTGVCGHVYGQVCVCGQVWGHVCRQVYKQVCGHVDDGGRLCRRETSAVGDSDGTGQDVFRSSGRWVKGFRRIDCSVEGVPSLWAACIT